MASIDEILKEFSTETSEDSKQFNRAMQNTLARDSVRRPWNRLGEGVPKAPVDGDSPTAWYGSLPSIFGAVKKHWKILLPVFIVSSAITAFLASYLPSVYNSSLQLYAPEKTDSISSRLNLFSNRVEFASFPVDFKIPLGLVARRLRDEAAKHWVVKEFEKRAEKGADKLLPSLVHADTFYADGSELLVIQGYANSPEMAASVTTLFWEYFENEIWIMRKEHLRKIDQWISLTSASLEQRKKEIASEMSGLAGAPLSESRLHLNTKLAEAYSDVELKRMKLQKELAELDRAVTSDSLGALWAVSSPEVQDLKQVYLALQLQGGAGSSETTKVRLDDIKREAQNTARNLFEQRRSQYAELQDQASKLKSQLDAHPIAGVSDRQRELLHQQNDYQNQIDELQKLRSQLSVEATLTSTRLRVIQPAVADPSTRRPLLTLKYSVCVLLGILFSFFVLVVLQFKQARKKITRPYRRNFSRSSESPDSGRAYGFNHAVPKMGA